MIKEAGVIFPHQLFENYSEMIQLKKIFIVEDSLFFKDKKYPFQFHKQKLIFHRASMQAYKDNLSSMGKEIEYLSYLIGVPDATNLINTGDLITVDGYLGIVIIQKNI